MNQHINSMLEHLSSLSRRKNSDSTQTSSNDKLSAEADNKEVNDIDTVQGKSKGSMFKNLISDNGATNIFQNFMVRCPSNLNTAMSSSANGTCKQKTINTEDSDNNNQQQPIKVTTTAASVQPNEICQSNVVHKKRNSTVRMLQSANGDVQRELSPSPRAHRKSSHDIRLLRNNNPLIPESGEGCEVGKPTGARPLKTKNIVTKNETFDTLHYKAMDVSRRSQLFIHSINYALKSHLS